MNVYQKLMAARLKLQNTDLKKSGHNKFAGYKYFELGDFLPTVQNIFNELGLCGVVSYTAELATLTISDGTDSIVITSPMGGANLKGCHEVQNIGAVETYQRRYLWVTALEIVEHDVLDATTGSDDAKKSNVVEAPKQSIIPTAGALDNLDEEERQFIRDCAESITLHFDANDFSSMLQDYNSLDNEEKVAVWSLLNSKVRSSVKKMKEQ